MEIKTILWPTDTSEEASQALPYAQSLAEKYQAEIIVLNVQDEVTRYEQLAEAINPDILEHVRKQFMNKSQKALNTICDQLGGACPRHKQVVINGDAAEEILKFVDKNNIDLVVMATHGYGGVKRFAFGSVVEKVTRRCPVPVLTVRCK
ncbi:MAG: universal stress protein [Deltaproteobacteria bacterium]|nr:universal stress protein [Deltaproteobacteria bacterium]